MDTAGQDFSDSPVVNAGASRNSETNSIRHRFAIYRLGEGRVVRISNTSGDHRLLKKDIDQEHIGWIKNRRDELILDRNRGVHIAQRVVRR